MIFNNRCPECGGYLKYAYFLKMFVCDKCGKRYEESLFPDRVIRENKFGV